MSDMNKLNSARQKSSSFLRLKYRRALESARMEVGEGV